MARKRKTIHQDVQQEENYSIIAGVLAGLIIVLGGGLLWSNQQRIIDVLDQSEDSIITEQLSEVTDDTSLNIGKDLAVSGILISDESYTYVSTSEYGIIGLENIADFSNAKEGHVLIGGTVTSFMNNTYFLTVNTFIGDEKEGTDDSENDTILEEAPSDSVFVAPAGVAFSELIVNEIGVEPNINQQYITIREVGSKNKITINYFLCQKGHKNYDCSAELAKLNKTKNLEKAYTTPEGDIIYRIKKTNQWYGSIDGRFGYYISANSQNFMKKVFPLMIFVSDKYIKQNVIPQLTSICTDDTNNLDMVKVQSSNMLFFDDLLSIDVMGRDSANKSMQCLVVVNLNTPQGGSLISLDYINASDRPEPTENDEVIDEEDENTENEDSEIDPIEVEEIEDNESDEETNDSNAGTVSNIQNNDENVVQFPVKIDDPFEHTFNAGYTIFFPSKNISFGSKNVSTSLNLEGTLCNIRTDVIDYPNREEKHTSPAVSVYVCSTSLDANSVGQYGYVASSKEGKAYIVEVNDPSWNDFAKNMKIEDN